MKACVLHQAAPIAQRPLVWGDLPTPVPGPGELLIRVHACGVCRTDLHVVEGELSGGRLPIIPGHQIVGTVQQVGPDVAGLSAGARVGVAWLGGTCGSCRYCRRGSENLCEKAVFTGYTRDGGYAEYAVALADFVYPLPEAISDEQAAPLLCAGIIGYRCLRQCGIDNWPDARLGLYGFGAAGHIAIPIARSRGAKVYVCTRDRERHQKLAEELGAVWVGGVEDRPPKMLDAAIIFAPAGEIVPLTLQALDRGGCLVLGGIHMSPIPELRYEDLYWERLIRTVANNTRADGREFLAEAASVGVRTYVRTFPLAEANEALIALKHDAIRGAGVLLV